MGDSAPNSVLSQAQHGFVETTMVRRAVMTDEAGLASKRGRPGEEIKSLSALTVGNGGNSPPVRIAEQKGRSAHARNIVMMATDDADDASSRLLPAASAAAAHVPHKGRCLRQVGKSPSRLYSSCLVC